MTGSETGRPREVRGSEILRLARHRCGVRPDRWPCRAHITQAREELEAEATQEAAEQVAMSNGWSTQRPD